MKLTFSIVFILICFSSFSQKITINGTVKDVENGETLIGVNIYDRQTQQGAITNNYGFYSYTTLSGEVDLLFSYVGYQPFQVNFLLEKDTTMVIQLQPSSQLEEVVVEAARTDQIQENTQMGSINVPLRQIRDLPALFGEVDVFKVLQLLPGVQSGTEGGSGLYVRGGGPDQNLILLDGVPVYNATHLFGFFSVFNADAINNVELIKGGFPARYGGRLSSVIDINMKDGNMKKFQGEGSIGLISSKLTLEGPIVKDKTSFLLSGRRTYLDLIAGPIIKKQSGGKEDVGYYFYDLNAKVNHIFNNNNRIYLSFYGGDDKGYSRYNDKGEFNQTTYTSKEETGLGWGNMITAARWNHVFNQRLFANFAATYTRYYFKLFTEYDESRTINGEQVDDFYSAEYRSGIRDYAIKADFDYIPNSNHYLRFGISNILHRFTPGVFVAQDKNQGIETFGGKESDSQEFSAYVEDDMQIGKKMKLNVGLHYSGFLVKEEQYSFLQPRIAARVLLDERTSLKASFVTMAQFIHLLTNAGLGLPTDLWVPSTPDIGPQKSWQASMGYYKSLPGNLELSVEGYYKNMIGLLEYQDGASFLNLEENWEDKIEIGEGRSYGAEFLLQKKSGKTTGWLGYTLSKTERRFDQLNEGDWFPFRYDRRHDISLTVSHHLTEKIHLSGTWVYGSGNSISVPTHTYNSYSGAEGFNNRAYVEYYESRNNFKMRDYHRLDVGISFIKEKRWGERVWNISVYNAYNRLNPFYMDIQSNYEAGGKKMLVQYSLFPVIPSFSYGFKF